MFRKMLYPALLLALFLVWVNGVQPWLGDLAEASAAEAMTDGVVSPDAAAGEGDSIGGLFLSLFIILLSAKVFGELFERVGQPAVLGELVAGVVLGGSVLGLVEITPAINMLAEIGVVILLFEVGLESKLRDLMKVGLTSLMVAIIGVALPFVFGYYVSKIMNVAGGSTQVAIFIGATLTATSVGITARVLSDLGKLVTTEGRIILGAAVIDDVIGLTILAVVIGLIKTGTVELSSIGRIAGTALIFLVASIVLGLLASPYLMRVVRQMQVRGILLVSSILGAFILAYIAHRIGLATIVGAFAAGLILEEVQLDEEDEALIQQVKPIADFLVPIFFVKMGLMVQLSVFADYHVLLLAVLITAVGVLGKILSGYGIFQRGIKRLAVGIGMIPRGEVGLIFASYGISHAVISPSTYSAILIMVMVTTFITPPMLKASLK